MTKFFFFSEISYLNFRAVKDTLVDFKQYRSIVELDTA